MKNEKLYARMCAEHLAEAAKHFFSSPKDRGLEINKHFQELMAGSEAARNAASVWVDHMWTEIELRKTI